MCLRGEKGDVGVGSRVVLRGDYDIFRREELRRELERLELSEDITVDMEGVTLMDAGSAALLIALEHRLHDRTPSACVILANAPRIVRRVLELCGVADLFVFSGDR